MDVDSDGVTDLILISAPMFKENVGEGRVYVCGLTRSVIVSCFIFLFNFNQVSRCNIIFC